METRALLTVLQQDPWFAGLDPGLQRDIVRFGQTRRFRNSLIYATGDQPNGLFAVLSGEVRVSYCANDGRLALLLVARPGSWIGETSMFDGRPRYSDALAWGDVRALEISPPRLAEIVGGRSDRYAAFVHLLCNHHRMAMDFIAGLAVLPARSRIAQRLIDLARSRRLARGKTVALNLSQDDLASAVGVSRQTVNAALRLWKRDGIVSLSYGKIMIEDWMTLLRIAKFGQRVCERSERNQAGTTS
jgi:CRP-like cAMP-binding protein